MNWLRMWVLGLLGSTGAIFLSVLWIDRPLSLFAHNTTRTFLVFETLTHIPESLPSLSVTAFIVFGFWALRSNALPRYSLALTLSSISLMAARAMKDQAKVAFGRTWPETWTHGNPSFIQDGAYGFHPFQGGSAYESFPSGHMTAITAVVGVLWYFYPKPKLIYVIVITLVAVGLLGANYHFLSDIIGGCFVGFSTAMMTIALARSFMGATEKV